MIRKVFVLAAAIAATSLASAAFADSFTATSAYWGASNTDASGNYTSPDTSTISGSTTALSAALITNGSQALANKDTVNNISWNVNNYVRAWSSLAGSAYDGSLLGDLSGKAGISASFNLQNSTLATGDLFTTSELAGQGLSSGANVDPVNPSIRFTFTGADGNVWFSTAGVNVTSMNNGQDSTLSVNFDSSVWSDINGKSASSETAAFLDSLSNVQKMGFAFGSGYFYSDGFAFNTGGNASFNIDSIATSGSGEVAAVPLPASVWSGMAMLVGVAGISTWKRSRLAKA